MVIFSILLVTVVVLLVTPVLFDLWYITRRNSL